MSIIQFSHANGFPAKTYSVLFKHLEGHKISAINILAENRKPSEINWHDMTEDILKCAGQFEEPVVGVGHSLGGVLTLMAAAKKTCIISGYYNTGPSTIFFSKTITDQHTACHKY